MPIVQKVIKPQTLMEMLLARVAGITGYVEFKDDEVDGDTKWVIAADSWPWLAGVVVKEINSSIPCPKVELWSITKSGEGNLLLCLNRKTREADKNIAIAIAELLRVMSRPPVYTITNSSTHKPKA